MSDEINIQELGAALPEDPQMVDLELTRWKGTKAYLDDRHPFHGKIVERVTSLYGKKYHSDPSRADVSDDMKGIHDALVRDFKTSEELDKAADLLRQEAREQREEAEIKKAEMEMKAFLGPDHEQKMEHLKEFWKGTLSPQDWNALTHSALGNDPEILKKGYELMTMIKEKQHLVPDLDAGDFNLFDKEDEE